MPIFDLKIFDLSPPVPQGMFDSEAVLPIRPHVVLAYVHGNEDLTASIHSKKSDTAVHGNEVVSI